ncbi:hydroxyacid dehydrogenase [Elioraea sp.]|uniref:hydroxyacid dehydrogenase n=1 Tax=Elioraea sp. TaxID=2185103 RepID=UPI00307E8721
MSRARIVVSEFMDEDAVAALAARFEVLYDATLVDDPSRLAAALADAPALIVRNRTQVRGALLEAAPRLSVVGRLGVGLDNIDVTACAERGIRVIPATGANADAVAEYVIAALLILLRGAFGATARIAAGEWPRTALTGREAQGRLLGLVGFGDIARRIVPRARALGMRVAACDPVIGEDEMRRQGVDPMTLDALIGTADVVSLHVPLTDTTRRLIDARRIAAMRPDAVLINTARGGIVDEAALVAALRGGRIGGAALDVFEDEPPEEPERFAGVPNLLLTPHIAGVTQESNRRVSALIAERVAAELERTA